MYKYVRFILWCTRNTPKWVHPLLLKPLVMWYSSINFSIKYKIGQVTFEQLLQDRARIIVAYEGSLDCGRDQKEWFGESYQNLSMFMTGHLSLKHRFETYDTQIRKEEKPWYVRLKYEWLRLKININWQFLKYKYHLGYVSLFLYGVGVGASFR